MALLDISHAPADTSEPILETTVGGVLRDAAAAAPERTAIVAYGNGMERRRTWTFAGLLRDAERTAQALLRHFEPGEHIAVWANNVPEWLLLEFGAALAKLVIVTVNPAYQAREAAYVLRQSRAVGLFHVRSVRGNPIADIVDQVMPGLPGLRHRFAIEEWEDFLSSGTGRVPLPQVFADDPAQIQYTSGTTGAAKGALLLHRGITNNARLVFQRYGVREPHAYAHGMPFFHTAGCVLATLGPVQAQVPQVFAEAFDPALMLAIIERERATHLGAVPTMLIAMLQHPDSAKADLSTLRVVASGGAMVPPELVRLVEERTGARFSIVFGQTEASPIITQVPADASVADKAATVGPPLPQAEVRIVDPHTGVTVPCGEVGELCVRGYQVMRGYFDMPEATAAAIDADGWLHTGDLATMDARGYCRIAGRLKEMVIRGGENLFPVEIEAALHEHPAILEAAVVGVPDPLMGEELAAFVRTASDPPPTEDELRAHLRARLAPQKTPRHWIFINAFPLTGSGKIQKFVLRERWESGAYAREREIRMLDSRSGGCLCGKVRFKAMGEPMRVLACHCTFCQRVTGSSFYAEAIYAIDRVEFSGPEMKTYAHRSTTSDKHVYVHFCPECGSTVTLSFERWKEYRALSLGCFDRPDSLPVQAHIWLESGHPGVGLPAGTPCFRQARATLAGVPEPSVTFPSPVTVEHFLKESAR